MRGKISKPKADKKSRIEIIQDIYGKDKGTATLEDTSAYLKKKGFKPLADLLTPSKWPTIS